MGGDQLLSWRTNKDSKGNSGSHSNPGFPLKEKDQRITYQGRKQIIPTFKHIVSSQSSLFLSVSFFVEVALGSVVGPRKELFRASVGGNVHVGHCNQYHTHNHVRNCNVVNGVLTPIDTFS